MACIHLSSSDKHTVGLESLDFQKDQRCFGAAVVKHAREEIVTSGGFGFDGRLSIEKHGFLELAGSKQPAHVQGLEVPCSSPAAL